MRLHQGFPYWEGMNSHKSDTQKSRSCRQRDHRPNRPAGPRRRPQFHHYRANIASLVHAERAMTSRAVGRMVSSGLLKRSGRTFVHKAVPPEARLWWDAREPQGPSVRL